VAWISYPSQSNFNQFKEKRMKRVFTILAVASIMAYASSAQAWNLSAKHVNALVFKKSGQVSFTLFENGSSGDEFKCQGNQQWFSIGACGTNEQGCIESVNRMASMLLAAKMAGRPVHVQRNNCLVTETAVKP
jgi:hypothetical protein